MNHQGRSPAAFPQPAISGAGCAPCSSRACLGLQAVGCRHKGEGELTASHKLVPTPGYNCTLFLLNRIALLQTPVCLEPGTEYSVDVYFSQPSASDPKAKSFILIDSVSSSVTIPLRLYLYQCDFFLHKLTQNILKSFIVCFNGNSGKCTLLTSVVTVFACFCMKRQNCICFNFHGAIP